MELKTSGLVLLIIGLLSGCSQNQLSDAYGQFEAVETTISSELSGKLLQFDVEEGIDLEANTKVGVIDTVMLGLQKEELRAGIASVRSRIANLSAQADVYKEQLATTEKDFERLISLKENNAATQQQIDNAQGQINTLKKQIAAVQVQEQSVLTEIETHKIKIARVEEQIDRATIINPVKGTVLATFVEPYELTMPGKPLYQIANTEELILRVYVSGAQLANVKLNQLVEVLIDESEESNQSLSGTVSWISSEAEFTPKLIQTKEERVTQMYAVKVRVPNPEGIIKIGMPGEVNFR
ncbi:MAG: HlyD family efflux transporter periplasmic adaptor subunit [Balneolaceae bacterium]|nr:HlyD family efflux transporter periplasmic adaptor subunit [Balneolaceae bacterium]MBO6547661.1 HlyD family efflux transporter periplasmic adaptor subunit [Balneolaceae bacterium]MBO6648172.1 HlyD family efflux transporter periplasmic adaptor subunit [Balneolaceae bacterium]